MLGQLVAKTAAFCAIGLSEACSLLRKSGSLRFTSYLKRTAPSGYIHGNCNIRSKKQPTVSCVALWNSLSRLKQSLTLLLLIQCGLSYGKQPLCSVLFVSAGSRVVHITLLWSHFSPLHQASPICSSTKVHQRLSCSLVEYCSST